MDVANRTRDGRREANTVGSQVLLMRAAVVGKLDRRARMSNGAGIRALWAVVARGSGHVAMHRVMPSAPQKTRQPGKAEKANPSPIAPVVGVYLVYHGRLTCGCTSFLRKGP